MNKTIALILVSFTLLIFGCVQQTGTGPVACTEDSRLCPDGSSVSRIPPSCEFAQCPTATPTGGAIVTTDLDSGIGDLVRIKSGNYMIGM